MWEAGEDDGRRERRGAKAWNEGDETSVAEKEGRRGTENERKRTCVGAREGGRNGEVRSGGARGKEKGKECEGSMVERGSLGCAHGERKRE